MALVAAAVLGLSACGSSDERRRRGRRQRAQARQRSARQHRRRVRRQGRHPQVRPRPASGATASTRVTPTTATPGTCCATTAARLVMFKAEPGKAGLELVPDLATDLGKSSDGGKTWTYTLQDGPEVRGRLADHLARTSRTPCSRSIDKTDVHARLRSYFEADSLDWPRATRVRYTGPKDAEHRSSAIETPDDTTIVFHLKEPFAGFDYLAQLPQTAPVPAGQGHRREVHEAPDLVGSVHVRRQRSTSTTGVHAGAQPQLGRGDRPEPQGAAGRDDREAGHAGRRPGQPDHLRRPSTSTSRAPACSRPRSPKVLQDEDAPGPGGQPDRSRGSGTPRSTRR